MASSTKVLALGTLTVPVTSPSVKDAMPHEVPPTLRLYLDGHMDQYWLRLDDTGVAFLMNAQTVDQARALLEQLPLAVSGLMKFEYILLGPLAPLGMLLPN